MSVIKKGDQELRRAAHLAELEAILRHGARNDKVQQSKPTDQFSQMQTLGICILVSGIAVASAWVGLLLWHAGRSIGFW